MQTSVLEDAEEKKYIILNHDGALGVGFFFFFSERTGRERHYKTSELNKGFLGHPLCFHSLFS